MRSILLCLTLSASALFACGGSQPSPTQPAPEQPAPSPGAGDAAAPAAPTGDAGAAATPPAEKTATTAEPTFDSLPEDKKLDVMRTKVVPNVGKVFKEHDAKKFGKFGCATCHGSKKGDPHEILPKLALSNGGFEKLTKSKPEVMKFMAEKVVPAMAEALGEKPFDPATKQGFGCGGCHAVR